MYEKNNWWHNYQIYRGKLKIFDNQKYKNQTPCFTYLPWYSLKKGDKLVLEVWAPDNNSKYIKKEDALTYLKGLETLRGLHFKVVIDGERILTWHWYFNKLQMFSALTAVRYASEDNWNTHYPIVEYTLEYAKTMKFIEAFKKAHDYFAINNKGIKGNTGHALTYLSKTTQFPTSLSQVNKLRKQDKRLNDFWT